MALFSADKKSLPVWLPWLLAAAGIVVAFWVVMALTACLLYTSPSPRDRG